MSLFKLFCIIGAAVSAFCFWHSIAAAALVGFVLFAFTVDFGPRIPA